MGWGSWVLVVTGFCLSVIAGSGVFQALFVMPEYFADPPASLRRYQQDRSFVFWLPLHAVALLTLVLALVANWHTDRRSALLVTAAIYLLTWVVTVVFFIPGVIAFNKVDVTGPPSPELARQGRRWQQRSWSRHVLTVAAALSALVALGT
jgi:hypothetical protein